MEQVGRCFDGVDFGGAFRVAAEDCGVQCGEELGTVGGVGLDALQLGEQRLGSGWLRGECSLDPAGVLPQEACGGPDGEGEPDG
ncbi:hypothetical protein [Streptomyces sp. TE33382]